MKLKFSLLDGSLKPEFPAIGGIFMPALSSNGRNAEIKSIGD
jgi:hypothetical protein